jgi:hypothetical protein
MKLNPFNLRPFFTKPIQKISRNIFSLQKCFPFCSTIDNPRKSSHFFNDVVPGTSAVYSHALKFQRPATIKWKPHLENNASFIGSVEGELKRMISKTGDFGVYTKLRVRSSNQPNSSSFFLKFFTYGNSKRHFSVRFVNRVLITMWNHVAEIAYEHLKPNHFICVSGYLDSYSGNSELCFKVRYFFFPLLTLVIFI